MRKLLVLSLACLPMAAMAQTPKSQALDVDGLRITASVVSQQPTIKVADPNNPQGPVRTVTPYELSPDLATRLVWLQIRNEGPTPVDVPYRGIRLGSAGDNDGPTPMPLADMKKSWGRVLDWATNTPSGITNWYEREVATRAESYLDTSLFAGGTIPPGGRKAGYVPFPKSESAAASLNVEILQGGQSRLVSVPLAP